MRQTQNTMQDSATDDGHVGELHAYCSLGESWRANKYDTILKDACHKAGYPISFASHDLRVLAVMAALNDDSEFPLWPSEMVALTTQPYA